MIKKTRNDIFLGLWQMYARRNSSTAGKKILGKIFGPPPKKAVYLKAVEHRQRAGGHIHVLHRASPTLPEYAEGDANIEVPHPF